MKVVGMVFVGCRYSPFVGSQVLVVVGVVSFMNSPSIERYASSWFTVRVWCGSCSSWVHRPSLLVEVMSTRFEIVDSKSKAFEKHSAEDVAEYIKKKFDKRHEPT